MEHETIDSDRLVPSNAHLAQEILTVAERAYGSYQPTVANPALMNIVLCHASNRETRAVKDILEKAVSFGPDYPVK